MKNYRYITLFLVAAFSLGFAFQSAAQQSIRHSNYLFNKLIINPGAAGSNDYIEVMAGYRKDWVGFAGSPQTVFLSVDGSAFQKRLGLGLQIINEQLGAYRSTGVVGTAAARVRLAKDKYLSLGASAGYFMNTLDGAELSFNDSREMAIPTANEQVSVFDMRAGIYYKDKKNFGGFSVFNVLEPEINYTGNRRSEVSLMSRHYYALAGRTFRVNSDLDLIPSVLYKFTEQGNDQLDINLKAMYLDKFGLGISVRGQESLVILGEFLPFEYLRFGYAFDFATNAIANNSSGTHEIMLAYRIIQNKNLTENPRYLFN